MNKVKILRPRDERGWVTFVLEGHWCEAKVYDRPSQFGINDGRVSKLVITKGEEWQGMSEAVYNYSRGLDFDSAPNGLVQKVVAFCEALTN